VPCPTPPFLPQHLYRCQSRLVSPLLRTDRRTDGGKRAGRCPKEQLQILDRADKTWSNTYWRQKIHIFEKCFISNKQAYNNTQQSTVSACFNKNDNLLLSFTLLEQKTLSSNADRFQLCPVTTGLAWNYRGSRTRSKRVIDSWSQNLAQFYCPID
jgi:hypothetical protein